MTTPVVAGDLPGQEVFDSLTHGLVELALLDSALDDFLVCTTLHVYLLYQLSCWWGNLGVATPGAFLFSRLRSGEVNRWRWFFPPPTPEGAG